MNETRYELKRHLEKVANLPDDFLSSEVEYLLWHLIYSVTDKVAYEKGLKKFAQKHHLDKDSFVESFKKFKPYPSEYGSFSEKAIRKLLPLMRFGSYRDFNHIDKNTQKRIEDLITGVENEEIRTILREKAEKYQLEKETDFQDLPLWLAQYIVYNRHAEASSLEKWTSVNDLETYLNEFKQHSLRNPIVEQVVMETLRVVRDIWQQYGQGQASFFDEIHIELGRELKKTAKEREKLSKQNQKNEDINLSIKEKLKELKKYNTRAYSITHQEKYKLWLEQKHISPYTGQIISPENLFTDNYEIEHIIPQSRFFDDSLSNKVVCESIVNKAPYKDRQLGLEFIKNQGGRIVKELSKENKTIKIFTEEQYRTFIKEHYSNNPEKTKKLLLEEIPEKMVARQMNDTCYISKFISEILSKIVRSDEQDEGVHSKNVILCTGKITSILRQDWGLNDIWDNLILPRFERMNNLLQKEKFTIYSIEKQKKIPVVPINDQFKSFQKKRIDHRHHALDAIIIACVTGEHINYINNQHALEKEKDKKEKQKEHDKLREKLCIKKYNKGSEENYSWIFKKPWAHFTQEVRTALEGIVVSFKQNLRVINKATNYYERWVEENGRYIKKMVKQEGTNWAIRKPLHEETISGKIYLDREEITKNDILTATRKTVDSSFDEKRIKKITDTGIQKILLNYLKYKGSPEIAFSPEGLEELNKNLSIYNDGKPHKPIYKVRIYEKGSGRFALGEKGRKYKKYVQGAPNLYFGIYQGANKRSFATIPLNEVIERQKQGRPSVPEYNEKGDPLLFSLSPNDLVYVPIKGENIENIDFQNFSKEQKERIYNVNDFSSTCYFTPNRIAKAIFPKEVDLQRKGDKLSGSYDTKTASLEGIQIKEVCIKLKVDRLGNISKA